MLDRKAAMDFLRQRKQAYGTAFSGPAGDIVLEDLARFCRGNASTFDPNDRVHALLEGRREVWLRIREYLDLSEDELLELKAQGDG